MDNGSKVLAITLHFLDSTSNAEAKKMKASVGLFEEFTVSYMVSRESKGEVVL